MVNTFLPFASFKKSARTLNRPHLGQQRNEALLILRANMNLTVGYREHPGAKMWKGYDVALASYGIHICQEWKSRGYIDNQEKAIRDLFPMADDLAMSPKRLMELGLMPWWFGWTPFHESHRSNLARKKQCYHYLTDDPTQPYVWPVVSPDHKKRFKRQHSVDSIYA